MKQKTLNDKIELITDENLQTHIVLKVEKVKQTFKEILDEIELNADYYFNKNREQNWLVMEMMKMIQKKAGFEDLK